MRFLFGLAPALFASCVLAQQGGPAMPTPVHDRWVKITDKAAFSPRDTAEDLVYDGKMWIRNGYYHGGKLTRDLWSSTDGANWTLVNAATPYDGYSEMVVFDGKMWAIKGSVWNSTDGVNWTQVLAKTPFGARGYGEVVVHQGISAWLPRIRLRGCLARLRVPGTRQTVPGTRQTSAASQALTPPSRSTRPDAARRGARTSSG